MQSITCQWMHVYGKFYTTSKIKNQGTTVFIMVCDCVLFSNWPLLIKNWIKKIKTIRALITGWSTRMYWHQIYTSLWNSACNIWLQTSIGTCKKKACKKYHLRALYGKHIDCKIHRHRVNNVHRQNGKGWEGRWENTLRCYSWTYIALYQAQTCILECYFVLS